MKKSYIICTALAAILLLGCLSGCGGSEGSSGSSSGSSSSSSQATAAPGASAQSQAAFSLPDPARVLPEASVETMKGVELEIDGEVYVFTQYSYSFSGSANLADSTLHLTFKLLAQDAGMELELLSSSGTYSEYAVLSGDYLLGYLTEAPGRWVLYLPGSVELDSTPNGSGGSFQNDSFGISVEPGEVVPDVTPYTTRCESCGGSGDCEACGGDGWADSIYTGEHDAFECSVCGGTGDCPVCDGTGYWYFD